MPSGPQKSPTSSTAMQPPPPGTSSQGSQSSASLAPKVPPLPNSPSLAQTIGMDESSGAYAKHIVKGNFMTLSARPKTVEQVVEHYRNLWNFVRVLHEKEDDGSSICNSTSCPRMSAGANLSFTWLNRNREPPSSFQPLNPSGVSYSHNSAITTTPLSQLTNPGEPEWIGKRSGFPDKFIDICQMIFRQMFRVYAHLYWAHFTEPFYHLNLEEAAQQLLLPFL
ncbi:hypothetical protein NCS56_01476700 [Fusarium sp. Ph1]|nr:hypothetical protein NCS56_01476700 [Fusarium sp. Ph1]